MVYRMAKNYMLKIKHAENDGNNCQQFTKYDTTTSYTMAYSMGWCDASLTCCYNCKFRSKVQINAPNLRIYENEIPKYYWEEAALCSLQRPKQDAQLTQRNRAAGCASFGQKRKTATGRQYFTDITGLYSTTVI